MRAGLFLYDQLGINRQCKHSMLSRGEARQLVPQLAPRTKAVAQYFDADLAAERLAEMIEDSEEDCRSDGAVLCRGTWYRRR